MLPVSEYTLTLIWMTHRLETLFSRWEGNNFCLNKYITNYTFSSNSNFCCLSYLHESKRLNEIKSQKQPSQKQPSHEQPSQVLYGKRWVLRNYQSNSSIENRNKAFWPAYFQYEFNGKLFQHLLVHSCTQCTDTLNGYCIVVFLILTCESDHFLNTN